MSPIKLSHMKPIIRRDNSPAPLERLTPMARRFVLSGLCLVLLIGISACGGAEDKAPEQATPELLIYCGITMVKPMSEIAARFEKTHGCRIILNQGGSEDLYQSLKHSRKGDLYLPGSHSYREKHLEEGLLGDYVYLGFNQASLFVPRGNPRGITGDLQWLLDKELSVVIGNPESCSIGKASEKILDKAGIYRDVVANCFTLAADSRNLNKLIKDGTADLMMNWRATGFFADNREHVEVIDLPEEISPRKRLLLNALNFSSHPELARAFMEYAGSREGLDVFRKHGFLTEDGPTSSPIQGS